MLSQFRITPGLSQFPTLERSAAVAPDDRWARDMQEDMKSAVELLFKFKAGLDKLHPECTNIVERMLAAPNRF